MKNVPNVYGTSAVAYQCETYSCVSFNPYSSPEREELWPPLYKPENRPWRSLDGKNVLRHLFQKGEYWLSLGDSVTMEVCLVFAFNRKHAILF